VQDGAGLVGRVAEIRVQVQGRFFFPGMSGF
jgi:hypothetical protein